MTHIISNTVNTMAQTIRMVNAKVKFQNMQRQPKTSSFILDVVIILGLCGMAIFPPLALGASAPWARNSLFLTALLLLSMLMVRFGLQGEIRLIRTSAWLFSLLFLAIAGIQLISIPPEMMKFISPKTFHIYQSILPNYVESKIALPVSLSPYSTMTGITRISILIITFFLVIHIVTKRWQIVCLSAALIGIGLFEAFYGLAEHFSGNKHIFWIPREFHLSAVTGTFHNKNFFSGLLEMIVFIALGLMCGVSARKYRNRVPKDSTLAFRVRFLQAMNSRRLHMQIVLGLIAVVMFVAIFFSLSRAGILCTIISFIGFGLFLGLAAGFRRYTLALLFIVTVLLAISTTIGMELVLQGLENAVTGQDPSWLLRLDLVKHAMDYLHDFLIIGSGFGTFALIYPHYQSIHLGDKTVDYLHNDWLQFFCETGLLGGLTITIGILAFYSNMIKMIIKRRDPFCKWVATGCLLGSSAILLHSFFDYNLSKVTANGIIFSLVIGLGFACIHMPGERRGSHNRLKTFVIPVKALPLRAFLFSLPIGLFVLWGRIPSTSISSDLHFNHYLASRGISNPVHFLQIKDSKTDPPKHLHLALEKESQNPHLLYYAALENLRNADEIVRKKAIERARDIVGNGFESQDPKGFEDIVNVLAGNIRIELRMERKTFLIKAKSFLEKAILARPSEPKYQLELALVILELEPESKEILRLTENARWLAPNKPSIQFTSGKIYLSMGLQTVHKAQKRQEEPQSLEKHEGKGVLFPEHEKAVVPYFDVAKQCFRKAISGEPSYTDQVYPMVKSYMGGIDAVYDVTPLSFLPYRNLSRELWKAGEWQKLLTCLQTTEKLIEEPHLNFFNPNPDPLNSRATLAQQKCSVLGMLGCWDERAKAVREYRQLLSLAKNAEISEARHLKRIGRTSEALSRYKKIIKNDWHNTDAMLELAETMTQFPGMDYSGKTPTPLDHLFTAIIHCTLTMSEQEEELPEFNKHLGEAKRSKSCACPDIVEIEKPTIAEKSTDNHENSGPKTQQSPKRKKLNFSNLLDEDHHPPCLTPLQYKRILTIIERTEMETTQNLILADFIRGAAAVLTGKNLDGIVILERLASQTSVRPSLLDQRHLIWFFLGYGYERLGDRPKAILAYKEVIQRIPNHLPSLIRLSKNGYNLPSQRFSEEKVAIPNDPPQQDLTPQQEHAGIPNDALQKLTAGSAEEALDLGSENKNLQEIQTIEELFPDSFCRTTFSGKIKLIGFDYQPLKNDSETQNGIEIGEKYQLKLYWQFLSRLSGNYRPIVQFCNKNWQPVIKKMTKFTKNQQPYLKNNSICGEVIVDKIVISQNSTELPYLRIGILSPEEKNSPAEFLKTDENSTWLMTAFTN